MTSSGPNRAGTTAAGGTLSGAEELQKVFKTLADPTRIRILRLLEQEELIVGELMDILGMAQSRVSRHLAVLREAGLLTFWAWPSRAYHDISLSFARPDS